MTRSPSSAVRAVLVLMAAAHLVNNVGGYSVNAIYSFGDSIADTGNLLRQGAGGFFASIGSYPYGVTISKPTGRCSDGLLLIDYFATALNLPLIDPYLDKAANFEQGVNFAVAGATALDASLLLEGFTAMPGGDVPLSSQLEWFKAYLNSTCSSSQGSSLTSQDCAKKKLRQALFLLGEIGGNDYNYAFFQGRSVEAVMSYVPRVVQAIVDAAKELIGLGATRLFVPGNFPIGCFPSYLALFAGREAAELDGAGCLKSFNNFSMYHNEKLQDALQELREASPGVTVVYADYYRAFIHLLQSAPKLGFEGDALLKACCGAAGGAYNFELNAACGQPGTTVCAAPSRRVSWDGIHLTQSAHKAMARFLLADVDSFAYPGDAVRKIWSPDCLH